MKKYMLILQGDGEQSAQFYDTWHDAENCRMNAECGMGWYAEVYCYMKTNEDDPYEPETYICIA